MESCFDAFHEKRRKQHSTKPMKVRAELTNLALNYGTGYEDLATIGQNDGAW